MYYGHSLRAFFDVSEVERTAHDLASDGGDRLYALIVSNTPVETGDLRRSWKLTPVTARFTGGAGIGAATMAYIVRVETDEDYAPDVEWGTGLYGPAHARYPIFPKPTNPRQLLAWRDRHTGQWVFARMVMHPGSPGQAMVRLSIAKLEHEIRYEGRLDDGLNRMVRRMELKARRSPRRLVRGR